MDRRAKLIRIDFSFEELTKKDIYWLLNGVKI